MLLVHLEYNHSWTGKPVSKSQLGTPEYVAKQRAKQTLPYPYHMCAMIRCAQRRVQQLSMAGCLHVVQLHLCIPLSSCHVSSHPGSLQLQPHISNQPPCKDPMLMVITFWLNGTAAGAYSPLLPPFSPLRLRSWVSTRAEGSRQ